MINVVFWPKLNIRRGPLAAAHTHTHTAATTLKKTDSYTHSHKTHSTRWWWRWRGRRRTGGRRAGRKRISCKQMTDRRAVNRELSHSRKLTITLLFFWLLHAYVHISSQTMRNKRLVLLCIILHVHANES